MNTARSRAKHSDGVSISAVRRAERLVGLAAELVDLRVNIILRSLPPALGLLCRATDTIPIVIPTLADPLWAGLVDEPLRGLAAISLVSPACAELDRKRLRAAEGDAAAASAASALLFESSYRYHARTSAARTGAGNPARVEARICGGTELETAFKAAARAAPGALGVEEAVFIFTPSAIIELGAQHRLPAVVPTQEFVDAGGLMVYGPNLPDMFRHAAELRRQDPQGRQARRSARRAAHEV